MMIKKVEIFFKENGIEPGEARAEANFLVCAVSGLSIEEITLGANIQNEDDIWNLAKKRVETKAPVQHIAGFSYFMGDKFFVTPDVLIPRPETEILVQKSVEIVKKLAGQAIEVSAKKHGNKDVISGQNLVAQSFNILDIGTGSGCIALEIAKNLPELACVDKSAGATSSTLQAIGQNNNMQALKSAAAPSLEVLGVDISTSALHVALKNMEALVQERRVVFRKSDIFSSIYDDEKFDIIVSNPPYIPILAKDTLDDVVKNFDPSIALFTQDKDGVEFYEKILKGAKKHLKPNGYVLFEIGFTNGISQSAIVAEIARSYDFAMEFIEKDLSGIDRVMGFSRQCP